MAEFPALPLFTDAYLADTRHLTTEEHGAYLLLLICAWRSRECALRDNDKTLARIAGLSPTRWRRMKPALIDFFEVKDGYWRQKKLTTVYAGVAMRVARNRANGAKGGRIARSLNKAAKANPKHKQTASEQPDQAEATCRATKTKAKTKTKLAAGLHDNNDGGKDSADFDVTAWREAAVAACGNHVKIDDQLLCLWHAAGVDLALDMVPTLKAITAREIDRTGAAPRMLAYFREAVLEAMQHRLAQKQASRVALEQRASKIMFDKTSVDHWLQLLGDANSLFRGDYMARHWFIARDHPVFLPAELGPNPRLVWSSHIPTRVYETYGPKWHWLPVNHRHRPKLNNP